MRFSCAQLSRRAEVLLDDLGVSRKSIDVALVGNRSIRLLNRKYLEIDEVTDVLSFPSAPFLAVAPHRLGSENNHLNQEKSHIGDIAISIGEAQRQATEDNVSLEVAIDRLLIHGLLHLLGFEHGTIRGDAQMRQNESRLLDLLYGNSS